MLIVPLKGDMIKTSDNSRPRRVTSYTSFKSAPAVYLDVPVGEDRIVYFSDIIEINRVKVEYEPNSRLLEAFGPIRRKFNLPQEGDKITVRSADLQSDGKEVKVEVTKLLLQSKKWGVGKGLMVLHNDDHYSLTDIQDIYREVGSEVFDKEKFQHLYFDYLPSYTKSKE
jgi:hypothetical protein